MGNEALGDEGMKIKTTKELADRVEKAIDAVAVDERYVESLEILKAVPAIIDDDILGELKEKLAGQLHDADGVYPMHPEVAALVMDIYRDGIENENADAMCDLGALYYTGRAGEQDYEKAAYYYDMADKAGNRQATENLGYIYYYGRTGAPDYEKAYHYFIKGALDGHLRSLYKIGDFYRNGYYVKEDWKEAFRIYEHCVEIMPSEAVSVMGADIYVRMGDCYYKGIGVEKDLLLAHRFMSLA